MSMWSPTGSHGSAELADLSAQVTALQQQNKRQGDFIGEQNKRLCLVEGRLKEVCVDLKKVTVLAKDLEEALQGIHIYPETETSA